MDGYFDEPEVQVLGIDDVMPIGIFTGQSIKRLLSTDPIYLFMFNEKVDGYTFTKEVLSYLDWWIAEEVRRKGKQRAEHNFKQGYEWCRSEGTKNHANNNSSGYTPKPKQPAGYFEGCSTRESVATRYRELALKHHPDVKGGDTKTMQAINAEHDKVKKMYN